MFPTHYTGEQMSCKGKKVIIDGKKYVLSDPEALATTNVVIVRTRDAGVHVGELVSREGGEVVLKNTCRIWQWFGANTLHELSLRGANMSKGRISELIATNTIIGVCEVIPCTEAAAKNLRTPRWH